METQQPSAEPGCEPADAEDSGRVESSVDALRRLSARLVELGEYARYFLSARADAIKVAARNIGVYAALGVLGLMAGVTFVVSAVVLICFGIAALLVWAFHSLWLGTLVAGLIFLIVLGAGAWLGISMFKHSARERTVRKYGARKQQQRDRFGTDVRQRGTQAQ